MTLVNMLLTARPGDAYMAVPEASARAAALRQHGHWDRWKWWVCSRKFTVEKLDGQEYRIGAWSGGRDGQPDDAYAGIIERIAPYRPAPGFVETVLRVRTGAMRWLLLPARGWRPVATSAHFEPKSG